MIEILYFPGLVLALKEEHVMGLSSDFAPLQMSEQARETNTMQKEVIKHKMKLVVKIYLLNFLLDGHGNRKYLVVMKEI